MNGIEIGIFLSNAEVGRLCLQNKTLELSFEYTQAWKKDGFALSPALPLERDVDNSAAWSFFENFLVQGRALLVLSRLAKIDKNNVFGLLLIMKEDLEGAVRLEVRNSNAPCIDDTFRLFDKEELGYRLNRRNQDLIQIWDGRFQSTVAGAQDKITVIGCDGAWGFGQGPTLVSDTILKFEPPSQPHLLLNEYLTTQIAKTLGYRVCEMAFLHVTDFPVLEIKRFDRKTSFGPDGKPYVKRRHTIDACQALGLPSFLNYEGVDKELSLFGIESGVSFRKLFSLKAFAVDYMAFVTDILDWMLFNLVMGNCDAHGKNLSFFAGRNGLTVAPWYDLAMVELMDGLDHTMAMGIGGVFVSDKVGLNELLRECRQDGIERALHKERLSKMLDGLKRLDLEALLPDGLTDTEYAFVRRFTGFLDNKIRRWEKLLAESS